MSTMAFFSALGAKFMAFPLITKVFIVLATMMYSYAAVSQTTAITTIVAHRMGYLGSPETASTMMHIVARRMGYMHMSSMDNHDFKMRMRESHLMVMRQSNLTGECADDSGCNNNGDCEIVNGVGTCHCDDDYLTYSDDDPCGYKRTPKWTVFVMEFFGGIIGYSGGGWILMSRGESDWMFALGVIEFVSHPLISLLWITIASLILCVTIIGIPIALILIIAWPFICFVWLCAWLSGWIYALANGKDGNRESTYSGWDPKEAWGH